MGFCKLLVHVSDGLKSVLLKRKALLNYLLEFLFQWWFLDKNYFVLLRLFVLVDIIFLMDIVAALRNVERSQEIHNAGFLLQGLLGRVSR